MTEQEETIYLRVAEPLLRNVSVVIIDCGCRPDEVHQLTWPQYNKRLGRSPSGEVRVLEAAALSVSPRVAELLDSLPRTSNYIFPGPHEDRAHQRRLVQASAQEGFKALRGTDNEIPFFVTYSLRHTAIMRLAESGVEVAT